MGKVKSERCFGVIILEILTPVSDSVAPSTYARRIEAEGKRRAEQAVN